MDRVTEADAVGSCTRIQIVSPVGSDGDGTVLVAPEPHVVHEEVGLHAQIPGLAHLCLCHQLRMGHGVAVVRPRMPGEKSLHRVDEHAAREVAVAMAVDADVSLVERGEDVHHGLRRHEEAIDAYRRAFALAGEVPSLVGAIGGLTDRYLLNGTADPAGRYASAGTGFAGEAKESPARLVDVFFPGTFPRRVGPAVDEVALDWTTDGRLRASAISSGAVRAEVLLSATRDRGTGWTEVKGIPVKDTNKFGVTLDAQGARLRIARDGRLYVKVHASAAGIVLFLPAAGTRTAWGRWERLP